MGRVWKYVLDECGPVKITTEGGYDQAEVSKCGSEVQEEYGPAEMTTDEGYSQAEVSKCGSKRDFE